MAQKPMLGFMDAYNPDTDDWSAYVERLDLFFLANEIKDDKKVAVLLTVLGTKAYSLLWTIIAPSKPAENTYKQLVDAISAARYDDKYWISRYFIARYDIMNTTILSCIPYMEELI